MKGRRLTVLEWRSLLVDVADARADVLREAADAGEPASRPTIEAFDEVLRVTQRSLVREEARSKQRPALTLVPKEAS